MSDEMKLARAQQTFVTLCETMDDNDWHYEKNDDELSIKCKAQSEDLPISMNVEVDAKRQVVMLLSHIPLIVPEDKRLEVAIAVSIVNNRLIDGCFDFSVKDGHMFFRMTNSFIDSVMGKDMFTYLVYCSYKTVDEYNDKFLMLAKGMISLEQFMNIN